MKQRTSIIVAIVAVISILAGYAFLSKDGKDSVPQASDAQTIAIDRLVTEFGTKLRMVSLLGPTSTVASSMDAQYSPYLAPELLASWKADPKSAVGKEASNPWPESISVVEVRAQGTDSYIVEANVIEVTTDKPQEAAAVYPVTFEVKRKGADWLIYSAKKGDYSTLPGRITVIGKQTCLEHRDKTGPQTLECALALKADDGKTYALDLNLLQSIASANAINSGERVKVEGIFTPVEALSNDMWKKYELTGILSVTSAAKI